MTPNSFQRHSRTMALGGLMAALSVVILLLGGLIPAATFACPMLAMLCLLPVLRECGEKIALVLYAAVSVLALLLVADKELALFYVFLGYYPILRPRLNKLPSPLLRILAKCGLFTAATVVMYLLILYLFQLEAIAAEFAEYSAGFMVLLLVLGNAVFLLLDQALDRLSMVYDRVLRKKLFH